MTDNAAIQQDIKMIQIDITMGQRSILILNIITMQHIRVVGCTLLSRENSEHTTNIILHELLPLYHQPSVITVHTTCLLKTH